MLKTAQNLTTWVMDFLLRSFGALWSVEFIELTAQLRKIYVLRSCAEKVAL